MQCEKVSYATSYGGRRCTNKGKMQHEGKWYCGVHDPVKKAARRDERLLEQRKLADMRSKRLRDQQRKIATHQALVDALEACVAAIAAEIDFQSPLMELVDLSNARDKATEALQLARGES